MDVEPPAKNTAPAKQDDAGPSPTAVLVVAATTMCVSLFVLSFRGGSVTVSTGTTALTVDVNPPQ